MFFISSQLMPLLRLDELVRAASPQTLAVVSFLFGRPELLENFFSGVIALAIFEAACVTEIVRAGIRSVSRGQWEAARSLGLGRFAAFATSSAPRRHAGSSPRSPTSPSPSSRTPPSCPSSRSRS